MLNQFVIKSSRILFLLLLSVHLLAIVSIWLVDFSLWICLALSLAIGSGLYCQLSIYSRQRWHSFTLNQQYLIVTLHGFETIRGELMHGTVVTPFFVMFCVRMDNQRRLVRQLIFRDAMEFNAFRELRVRLTHL